MEFGYPICEESDYRTSGWSVFSQHYPWRLWWDFSYFTALDSVKICNHIVIRCRAERSAAKCRENLIRWALYKSAGENEEHDGTSRKLGFVPRVFRTKAGSLAPQRDESIWCFLLVLCSHQRGKEMIHRRISGHCHPNHHLHNHRLINHHHELSLYATPESGTHRPHDPWVGEFILALTLSTRSI